MDGGGGREVHRARGEKNQGRTYRAAGEHLKKQLTDV